MADALHRLLYPAAVAGFKQAVAHISPAQLFDHLHRRGWQLCHSTDSGAFERWELEVEGSLAGSVLVPLVVDTDRRETLLLEAFAEVALAHRWPAAMYVGVPADLSQPLSHTPLVYPVPGPAGSVGFRGFCTCGQYVTPHRHAQAWAAQDVSQHIRSKNGGEAQ